MRPRWLARIQGHLGRFRGSGLVVAVSGGGDSVGLLRAIQAVGSGLDLRVSVAHLDHGSRGEESRADARFVEELAASLGLPFDLGHWRATRSGHFEADARRARYEWLAGVARARGASVVAVGQTLDDQAETILHRIVRGTGIKGLAGIPAHRRLAPGVVLVRPLLGVTREEIRDYLAAIGQDFREDASNLDTSRTRARLRHELLPTLAEHYNPAVAEALVRLGRLASNSNRILEKIARERSAALILTASPDRIVLDRAGLAALNPFERAEILRHAWDRVGWPLGEMDARRWGRLAKLDRGRISIGAGVEAETSDDHLILSRSPSLPELPPCESVALSVPGWVNWGNWQILATLDPLKISDEWVDFDRLHLPLRVCQARPGDRFEPLGLEGRSQPLNDFFRGRKVPKSERGTVPIVRDAEGIVWVAGHRIAHRVRRTEATTRLLGLRRASLSDPGASSSD
ncbi:tRNA lysidine(34) synthetase TilS [Tundrisphaera lichenicola]|uniref:tRNA lysidine(34) synthetase TilS n=1 Tax=Tundrisphaera lichenicola TaxID=2029860 RepID=UPI003EBDE4C3